MTGKYDSVKPEAATLASMHIASDLDVIGIAAESRDGRLQMNSVPKRPRQLLGIPFRSSRDDPPCRTVVYREHAVILKELDKIASGEGI
jgi:hypothetical protein